MISQQGTPSIANMADKVPAKTTSDTPSKTLDENPIQYATSEPGVMTTEPHDKEYMELTLRTGKHSSVVQKLLRQRIEQRAREFPRWPADSSSGVRLMWIESRFWYDRERLSPDFDDDWRSYRAKYLHSLELDPREPVHVPEYETELLNPIRRFYMRGGDWIENNIVRKFTQDKYKSALYRVLFTRSVMIYLGLMGGYYWFRYTNRKWDVNSGPVLWASAPILYPNHPKYPFQDYKTEPWHHWDVGFSKRTIFKDLNNYKDNTTIL